MQSSINGLLFAGAAITVLAAPSAAQASTAKNVMMFISDGASWGTWDMASYWQYGERGRQSYDGFDVKLGMTTEPASNPQRVYDPQAAWDTIPTAAGADQPFEGYATLDTGATDSAAAGTALSTGQKTANGRIAADEGGTPLRSISQDAKAAGKSVGVVSSVPFSHATPAAFGAQNESRDNYGEIATQMINEGTLDVVMGTGNPNYGLSGEPLPEPNYFFVGEGDWEALNGPDAPMTLITGEADFDALADGSLEIDGRLIGVPQTIATLQYTREAEVVGADPDNPSGVAYADGIPALATMTEGALNHLGKDEDGLFLMVEGGAVDWAAHDNDTARVIEEQVDFNRAVDAAVEWVEERDLWEETLMIVLTDHGNGMTMGPDSDTVPFQAILNNGAGALPGVLWHSGSHTTENTLLWANGAGADAFFDQVVDVDPFLASVLGFNDGRYIDNTGVLPAILAASGITPVPAPAGIWLMLALMLPFGVLNRLRSSTHAPK